MLLNMKKFQELKEYQSKELLLIIMQLKLKLNIFLKKSNKLSLNMNQLKEHGKEFNISQLKLKLFTIQNETITSLNQENLSKVDILNHHQLIKLVLLMYQPKAELELKQFIKLVMSQPHPKVLMDKLNILMVDKLNNMLLVDKLNILPVDKLVGIQAAKLVVDIQAAKLVVDILDKPMSQADKINTLLEDQELEGKQFTKLLKLEVMLLEDQELDNIEFDLL